MTLGEPLCFLAFGPLATSAFYLAQVCPIVYVLYISLSLTLLGLHPLQQAPHGLPANRFRLLAGQQLPSRRQLRWAPLWSATPPPSSCCAATSTRIEGDLAAGKMSPLVRLGPRRGTQVAPLFPHGTLQDNALGSQFCFGTTWPCRRLSD